MPKQTWSHGGVEQEGAGRGWVGSVQTRPDEAPVATTVLTVVAIFTVGCFQDAARFGVGDVLSGAEECPSEWKTFGGNE